MTDDSLPAFVMPLDHPEATLARVGGKGAALSELARGGLPVPGGFHVTTDAYRAFVGSGGIAECIDTAVARLNTDDPASADEVGEEIRECFRRAAPPESIEAAIRERYAALGHGGCPVAVRSSATAEDLPDLSFAGQQDTYLNVQGEAVLLEAVKNCWASLWTGRAITYRARNGIPHEDVSLAVVVQELVPAEAAGVLFTINPLTGDTGRLVINAGWGLGEAVVSGLVTPDTIVVDRRTMTVVEEQVADKDVMTVATATGTEEVPVPEHRRSAAVLTAGQAEKLARFGLDVEALYNEPRDIEWAVGGDRFFILQARPITAGAPPALDEWNDSLDTDSLWTSANLGEAVPDVMTPAAWSFIKMFMDDVMVGATLEGRPMYGNIGGRFYMNLSITATLAAAFGQGKKFAKANELIFGGLPAGMEIPLLPASRLRILRDTFGEAARVMKRIRVNGKKLPEFLESAPTRCAAVQAEVEAAASTDALRVLWADELAPYFRLCCHMAQAAGRQDGDMLIKVRGTLRDLVGDADADLMTTGLQADGGQLASLGPLLGLERLARGEIDRAAYARRYGHRSPHEFEVSIPRPNEDAGWIDAQLAAMRDIRENSDVRLGRQETARAEAWERLERRHPKRVKEMREAIRKWAASARLREAGRSEIARVFAALRAFVLRAGELTGAGDDLFFLSIEEILAVLGGDRSPLAAVPGRRATYERYTALPPYPTLILGRFDPFVWAADPNRRADVHDAHDTVPATDTITGSPASGGVVEGIAQVIGKVEEGGRIQPGEILVTTVTNIGWTPLFTRISAIVTDVGANLSHASIVARELGIPAVVGCGNATTRIRTGDRIRVDGGRGVVDVIESRS